MEELCLFLSEFVRTDVVGFLKVECHTMSLNLLRFLLELPVLLFFLSSLLFEL